MMTVLIAAMALAAAPAPTAAQPVPAMQMQHAQPARPGTKPEAKGCCCKKMAEGGKMGCCAEHGEAPDGAHAEHGTTR